MFSIKNEAAYFYVPKCPSTDGEVAIAVQGVDVEVAVLVGGVSRSRSASRASSGVSKSRERIISSCASNNIVEADD